ncbi:hypothetical protein TrST_g805 [Triparma strigata]|uniref:Kinesin motor domain-containing protein n=1 Tax=Triparma strigata TaxID=1606541 RepID=A0A9W7BEC8_9STRA|nr:hypothetical protein TrST_g805 [Triparma strigata]
MWAKVGKSFGSASAFVAQTALGLQDRVQTTLSEIDAAEQDFQKKYGSRSKFSEEGPTIYKEMLTEFQMEQTTLCREYQQIVAEKEAEIQQLRREKNADGEPEQHSLSNGDDASDLLEVEQLRLEKDVLSDTVKAWEGKLRELLKERTENVVEIKKLSMKVEKMEESADARRKAAEIVGAGTESPTRKGAASPQKGVKSPKSVKATEETIENLVLEYTKLSAENQRNADKHEAATRDFKTKCEEYETKIQAQEQNILLLMKKGEEGGGSQGSGGGGGDSARVRELEELVRKLRGASSKSNSNLNNDAKVKDLEKLVEKLQRELKAKANAVELPPPPVSSATNNNDDEVKGLKGEVSGLKEQLEEERKSAQSQIAELKQKLQDSGDQSSGLKKDSAKELQKSKEVHSGEVKALQEKMDELRETSEAATSKLVEAHSKEIETLKLEVASMGSEGQSAASKLSKDHEDEVKALEGTFEEKVKLLEKNLQDEKEVAVKEMESKMEAKLRDEVKRVTDRLASEKGETEGAAAAMLREETERLMQEKKDSEAASAAKLKNEAERLMKEKEDAMSEAAATLKSTSERLMKEKEDAMSEAAATLKSTSERLMKEKEDAAAEATATLQTTTETLNKEMKDVTAEAAATLKSTTEKLNKAKEDALAEAAAKLQSTTTDLKKEMEDAAAEAAATLKSTTETLNKEKEDAAAEAAATLKSTTETLNKEKEDAAAEAAATLKSTTETLNKEKEDAVNTEKELHEKTKAEYEKKLEWLTEKTKELVKKHQEEEQKLKEELEKIEGVCAERQRIALEEAAAIARREKDEAVEAMRKSLMDQVLAANSERNECKELYQKEAARRKVVHNKLIELQGNIRVIARVRPVVQAELNSGEHKEVVDCTTNEDLVVHRDPTTRTRFEFDKVCDQGSSQADAYELVSPLVTSVLDGYNVCIFAYGQTGSGKTYTMEGPADNRGVNYQAIAEMFKVSAEREEDVSYTFKVSMLEIYNETVRDLLSPSLDDFNQPKVLKIRQTNEGNVVQGLTELDVMTSSMVEEAMKKGGDNRSVGSHSMNMHSSRSHLIVTVTTAGVDKHNGVKSKGKLHLIDLAGSERISKTDASGERLKEAQSINNSLSALGNVINALGKKKVEHVPYRNSQLTFLLQDSLGGNSKVMMFVNLSPVSYNMNESLCSLSFAARCRAVQLGSGKKNDNSKEKEIKRLKNVIRKAGISEKDFAGPG